jgi:hypothetical protein
MPRDLRALCSLVLLPLLLVAATAAQVAALTLYASGTDVGGLGNSALYTVDPATGVLTRVGTLHVGSSATNQLYRGGLAYDPFTDRLYGMSCDSTGAAALFLIDRLDASMSLIGYCGAGPLQDFCSGGLAFDLASGKLLAVAGDNGPALSQLFELDPATGVASVIGPNGARGTYLSGLGIDPQTGILYGNGYIDFSLQSTLFQVNKGSGASTPIGSHGLTFGRQMDYSGLAIHPLTGEMLAFGSVSASQSGLWRVSKSSGAATLVAPITPNAAGVDGALVYVGVDLLDAGGQPAPRLPLRVWPDPASGPLTFAFGTASEGAVMLTIVDLAGRRVAALEAGRMTAGPHTLAWDRTGLDGRRVAPGTYFATLRVNGVPAGRATAHVLH